MNSFGMLLPAIIDLHAKSNQLQHFLFFCFFNRSRKSVQQLCCHCDSCVCWIYICWTGQCVFPGSSLLCLQKQVKQVRLSLSPFLSKHTCSCLSSPCVFDSLIQFLQRAVYDLWFFSCRINYLYDNSDMYKSKVKRINYTMPGTQISPLHVMCNVNLTKACLNHLHKCIAHFSQ